MPIHIPVKSVASHDTSDGYHTFDELYKYRMLYNAGFFNMLYIEDLWCAEHKKDPMYRVHKSTKHADGERCFGGGWFIVIAYLDGEQISNHYEMADWEKFKIPVRDTADKWDGHTPEDAAERIEAWLTRSVVEEKTDHEKAEDIRDGLREDGVVV